MSKDRAKPILDKLGITPTGSWTTHHIYKPAGDPDTCYYYTFEHKGKTYCISADSISFVFSDAQNLMELLKKQEEDNKPILYVGRSGKKVIMTYEEYQKQVARREKLERYLLK